MNSETSGDNSDGPLPADQCPQPPHSMTDELGREIDIRLYDDDIDELVTMYEKMDTYDRAQGLPPRTHPRVVSWLETLIEEGVNLVAWHDDVVVGHAAIVPMEDEKWELVIFIRSDYQKVHIGSGLMECLLGYAHAHDIETIWLTVERHNNIAINLYRRVGFERVSEESLYHMERSLG
jgi:ribosomal protein S18 acetylase RimI-like enzyme